MKKIKNVFECPTCKANLIHRRVNDGYDLYRISKNGKTKYLGSKSNTDCDEVYCSKNQNHLIPKYLQNAVFSMFNLTF